MKLATMEADDRSESPKLVPRRRRRWSRLVAWTAISLLVILVAAELFARLYLGLGDPPLSMADPDIEYLFKPSQDVRRFGNRIHYNAFSMRADDFPLRKSDPNELRVLVIGDSVVNGGAQTDQSELATSILQARLSKELGRRVVVGNASAASWGPPNMLAYAQKLGLLDADILVIVLSSHDAADVPTFAPVVGVHVSFPDHKPLLALQELIVRYLLPRLAQESAGDAAVPSEAPAEQKDIDRCLRDLRELIEIARSRGVSVIVAQYLERSEMSAEPRTGHDLIKQVAEQSGADVVQFGPAFREAYQAGRAPFRDTIHPNPVGQKLMADVLYGPLYERLSRSVSSAPAPATLPGIGQTSPR